MKKKIVGIFVCMLVIATAIPAVTSVQNGVINTAAHCCPSPLMALMPAAGPGIGFLKESTIDSRTPRLPLGILGGGWKETQKLTIPNGKIVDFGNSVAIDGDTAFIGAPVDANFIGSVYVYTRNGTTWTQQQKLTPSDPGVDDCFGVRVSLDGDTAVVGADDEVSNDGAGAAYVFTRTGNNWTQQQKLKPSDGAPGDWFGGGYGGVSLNGDTVLIGACGDDDNGDNSGSAYVFTRAGSTWTQQQKLTASDAKAGDSFGQEVSLSGDTALIGVWADGYSLTDPGHAYVFTRTGATWTQQAELIGSDSAPGDSFGCAVSLNGDTALVGAANDDDNGAYSGTTFVFTRTGTTWTQQAKLLASDGTYWDWFGCSVSLEGNTAIIGAADDENFGQGSGSAYVFTRTGTSWTQQQHLFASNGAFHDYFGWPVCLNENTAFIVAWCYWPNGPNSNSVYVFTKLGNLPPVADFSWTPQNPKPKQPITLDASTSHDPDGTITLYEWDWNDDGVFDETHTSPTATHTWNKTGSYRVTLRVTDNGSATGTLTKTVNVNDAIVFDIKITGGFGLKAAITNNGTLNATQCQWTFNLTKGFILLGKTKGGTIASLLPGGVKTVRDIPLLGFGKTVIRVNVTCTEGYSGTQTAIGTMFLFFVGVKQR